MQTHSIAAEHTSLSLNSHSKTGKARRRAFLYVRVSTDMQAQYGLSLDAQKLQMENYAKVYNYNIVGCFVDHDSAKNVTGRPQYQKMIAELDKGKAEFIISASLDRFSRSQMDFLVFQEQYVKTNKVHLVLIKEGVNTELASTTQWLPLLVAFAQMERERTSERVKGIISYIRSQGGHYGKVPFGYMTVTEGRLKKLVPHPENHKWLQQMAEWYKAKVSYEEIANRLNENSVKPSYNDKWTKTSVYDFLINQGIHVVRSDRGDHVYDKEKAYNIAYALKTEGKTFSQIAEALNKERLRPAKSSAYHWWSVQNLLRSAVYHDRSTPIGCAKY